MNKTILAVGSIAIATMLHAQAQLAITEVMTAEADSSHPDWWELTDFGTNAVNLTGYSWNDDSHSGFAGADTTPFAGVTIHPGESIIFTEPGTAITSATDFRTWWGISGSVQVVMLGAGDPGLGASGDSVRLWSTNVAALGANTNGLDLDQNSIFLVDKVDTLPAPKGRSLICNTNNGTFGITNTTGVNGAFTAATTADVGSPGIASTNPGPSVIVIQPTNALVNVGATATFQIKAFGFPKPRFQWLEGGGPVDTNRVQVSFAVSNNFCLGTITITNVQVQNVGTFRVNVMNGFQTVVSSNATLTVNTSPIAPTFTQTIPATLYAYPGQTVTLAVSAFANPPPTYQWQSNSINLDGQTDTRLQIPISDTNQSATYTIIATNSAGGTNASMVLIVTLKPDLRITEVMSSESTNNDTGDTSNHGDWWELSNFGNFPVPLQGYRFDDDHFSFADADTITNDVTIQPGESVVFVNGMTRDQLVAWWGATNLPPNLQIIDFPRIGFSATSDSVYLWNAASATESDYIVGVSIGTAVRGTSFGYDPNVNDADYGFLGYDPDGLSAAGQNGAFVAPGGGDIGSPGTVLNLPNVNSVAQTGGGFFLSWLNQPNWNYIVQYKTNLTDAAWQTLTNFTSDTAATVNIVDPATDAHRFYRVKVDLQNQ